MTVPASRAPHPKRRGETRPYVARPAIYWVRLETPPSGFKTHGGRANRSCSTLPLSGRAPKADRHRTWLLT